MKLDYLKNLGFPEEISELPQLRELSMRCTGIKAYPESMKRLVRLEALDLGENGIESIPPAIAGLKRLKRLNLEQNKISRIDEAIGECGELEELNLNKNEQLEDLPESLGKLKNLQTLKLRDYKSQAPLPNVFDRLSELRSFEFSKVRTEMLPPSIYECRSLNELRLFGMPISSLDRRISNLVNLEFLDLRMTGIGSIPTEIGSLKKLKKLELPKLTEPLPASISELVDLEELEVDFKGVEQPFPNSIAWLKSLTRLSVNAKGAKSLPEGFEQLHTLKHLTLRGFDFGVMPIQICGLKGLLTLDMMESNISEIPLENLTLHSLKFLELSRNPVSESSTWKKKLKACLPGTSITWK
jgi:Leucine-rich repeat (LRR) protein